MVKDLDKSTTSPTGSSNAARASRKFGEDDCSAADAIRATWAMPELEDSRPNNSDWQAHQTFRIAARHRPLGQISPTVAALHLARRTASGAHEVFPRCKQSLRLNPTCKDHCTQKPRAG
jgi:hypothetical protein